LNFKGAADFLVQEICHTLEIRCIPCLIFKAKKLYSSSTAGMKRSMRTLSVALDTRMTSTCWFTVQNKTRCHAPSSRQLPLPLLPFFVTPIADTLNFQVEEARFMSVRAGAERNAQARQFAARMERSAFEGTRKKDRAMRQRHVQKVQAARKDFLASYDVKMAALRHERNQARSSFRAGQ
jgi:hypothetical protein